MSDAPDQDGRYPDNFEVTLRAAPDIEGYEIIWDGVDFYSDNVAGVTMGADRAVSVSIRPGRYSPTPQPEDDHGDSMTDATLIFLGSTFGTIDPPSDTDFFSFFAQAGESYVIETILGDHPDTLLALYQDQGILLIENDYADGLNGGSRIVWTAPSDGE